MMNSQNILGQNFSDPFEIGSLVAPNDIFGVDIDRDSDIDIVTIGETRLLWYENNGHGSFIERIISDTIYFISHFSVGDIDDDNDIDIIYSEHESSGGIKGWYENDGFGNFINFNVISDFEDNPFKVFDLDGDGYQDLVHYDLYWNKNQGPPNFDFTPRSTFINNGANSITNFSFGDIDQDGDVDLFTGNNGSVNRLYWIENLGNGSFRRDTIAVIGSEASATDLADLDADGDLDFLYISRSSATIGWIENLGNLSFSLPNILPFNAHSAYDIEVGDFNGDNLIDILVSLNEIGNFVNEIYYYEGLGLGQFGNPQMLSNEHGEWTRIIAQDVDGDFDLDVIFSSYGSNEISWIENFYNGIMATGKVFYDENQNGLIDFWERGLANFAIDYNPIDLRKYSNEDGVITLPYYQEATSITASTNTNWNITTPDPILTNQIDTSSSDTIYFGLSPNQSVNDATINITSGLPRCNTEVPFQIVLTNTGTTVLEGTLETTNIDLIDYVNGTANPMPDNINNGQLSWNFEDIYPGGNFTIDLNYNVDGVEQLGEFVCLNAQATILTESTEETTYNPPLPTGESDLINICHCTGSGVNPYVVLELPQSAVDGQGNYDHANHGCDIIPITDLNNDGEIDDLDCLVEQTSYTETTFLGSYKSEIRCSFDPNDKAANPAGESEENYTLMGQDIIYTIRFQNTGNDTAFRVELIDTLSENLNIETFDFITSSHRPVDITIESVPNQDEHVLKFLFADILLPDSTTDLVGSNGFVQFSIRPVFGLPEPTILTNDAGIYFDFNPPVITNLVDHTLVYTIPDYRAPVADCQNEIEVELDENGSALITAEQLNLNSTDNVGITSFEASKTIFNCSDVGSNSVQLTVFDAAENSAVCQANVVVKDNIKPTIVCEDISITIQDGETITLTPEEVTTNISDNCSIESSVLSKNTFSNSDAGDNNITLVVKDPSGNETSCNINVEVTVVSNVLESQFGITATIAPNPFSNFTTLSLSKNIPFSYDVKIVDLSGKVVQEYLNQNQQVITIQNQNWASGLYLLNIFESGENEVLGSFRIVKE